MKAKGYTKETITQVGEKKTNFPDFNVGDTVAVHLWVKEGNKERVQVFQGDVIAINKNGVSSTFTVRKIGAHSVAVERILPFHSPNIKDIKVIKRGDVRRAKLYYVRDRLGKAARIQEKRESKKEGVSAAEVQSETEASHATATQ